MRFQTAVYAPPHADLLLSIRCRPPASHLLPTSKLRNSIGIMLKKTDAGDPVE
jgi:hypothetical protein